jgi:energy-coupling factor transport system permease protein
MNTPRFQTVSRETVFSRLDFRAKLAVFAALTTLAALWSNPLHGALLLAAVLAACAGVGIPGPYLRLMLRVMAPFGLLMLCTHGFFNKQHVARLLGVTTDGLTSLVVVPERWWIVGGARLTLEGALYGVGVFCRSLTFLLLVPLCVFTTHPDRLVLGLVRLRMPYKLVFVFSSSLRFFPLIFDEIRAVMETQRLRGYALEEMGTLQRVRVYARIAVPVILGAMFKAQQIEVVLQSKAFSGSPDRTYLHDARLNAMDWFAIALSAATLAAGIGASVAWGFGAFASR